MEIINKEEIIKKYIDSIPLLLSSRYDRLYLEKKIDAIIMMDNYFQISALYYALKLQLHALVNHLVETKPNNKMARKIIVTEIPITAYKTVYLQIKSSIAIRMLQDPMTYLAIVYSLVSGITDYKYIAREFSVSSGIIREISLVLRLFK